jgi:cytosolic prostaglandin-E synthase
MESSVVPLKWAQSKKKVFLTLEAKNLSDEGRTITLTPEGHLHFEGKNKVTSSSYKLELDLFDEVVVDTTMWKVTDFSVQFNVSKKNENNPFWPRLTKEKIKSNFITIDWTRWVDEDEADEKNIGYDPEGFDNLPDEDYDDQEDEDDEEEPADLNDLEDNEKVPEVPSVSKPEESAVDQEKNLEEEKKE